MPFPDKLRVNIGEGRCWRDNLDLPDVLLLRYVAEMLHFEYEILRTEEDKIIPADLSLACTAILEHAHTDWEFTVPYGLQDVPFFAQKPTDLPKFEAFVYPFSTGVWIFCIVLALLATVVSKWISSSKASLVNTFVSILGSLFKQPLDVEIGSLKKLIWWTFWLIWAGVISSLYSALVVSFLTIPGKELGVKNFQELTIAVQSKRYKCAVPSIPETIMKLMNTTSAEFANQLVKSAIENNLLYRSNNISFGKNIAKNTAVVALRLYADLIELSNNRIKVVSEDVLVTLYMGVGMRRDFCCKEQFNAAVLSAVSTGLTQKWFYDISKHDIWKNKVLKDDWEDEDPPALTVEDLKYVFLLMLIGYVLSILVFIWEFFIPERIINKYIWNCPPCLMRIK